MLGDYFLAVLLLSYFRNAENLFLVPHMLQLFVFPDVFYRNITIIYTLTVHSFLQMEDARSIIRDGADLRYEQTHKFKREVGCPTSLDMTLTINVYYKFITTEHITKRTTYKTCYTT